MQIGLAPLFAGMVSPCRLGHDILPVEGRFLELALREQPRLIEEMRRCRIAARAVLQQGFCPDEVFPEFEHAHETVAHHGVLFLAPTVARDWWRVILRKGSAQAAGNARRRQTWRRITERHLG